MEDQYRKSGAATLDRNRTALYPVKSLTTCVKGIGPKSIGAAGSRTIADGCGAWRRTRAVSYRRDNVVGFLLVHLFAALAFVPFFFSWTGFVLFALGVYVYGVLGINVGFHRMLTHRGFTCPRWFEHALAILGTCSLQFSPAFWVAVHRRHHHHADDENDPHSPLRSFTWAHFGWLLARPPDMGSGPMTDRYARDLLRDPLYVLLERRKNWIKLNIAVWFVYFFGGFFYVLLSGEGVVAAWQFGVSLFVWGCALRTVVVWHTAWSVNSLAHLWGYRNYATPDDSRNNVFVAILAAGEGWHNNHHADPTSARHGHKWWEFDLAWVTIRLLMLLGLATNVALPSPGLASRFNPPART